MFELIVRRPVAVAMLSLAAALFGALSYQQRPMSLMPPLTFPSLTIQSRYEGAAPEEIEVELTTPIEERLGTLEGLKSMRSRNQAGVSLVQLELAWGTDLNATLQRVYERLDRLQLPPEVDPPQVLRYDPTLDPLMVIALTPPASPSASPLMPSAAQRQASTTAQEPTALSLSALRRYAEESLTPAIHQVKGVAAVKVTGGEQVRVEVALHREALTRYGLTPQLIASKLKAAHVNLAGGQLVTDSGEVLVRTLAQLNDLETLKRTIVHQVGSTWVRLSDIAEVRLGVQERTSWVQVGLQEAVRVQIYRQADANLVEVARDLRSALFKERGEDLGAQQLTLRPPHPKGVGVHLVDDQASFIESALSAVGSAILSGGLLAVLILYLFLGSAYQTLVVALSIPLSVILSFIPLHAFGVSLNLMSLGGLALGVGMLVDNAVVVLESIAKRRERGAPPLEAAAKGAREVGGAVFASTLTTVAVFLPVALIDGIAGQVFRDLALTVVSALIASLVVALVVVPTLAARDRTQAHAQQEGDLALKEPPQGLTGRGFLPLGHWSRLWQSRASRGARWYLSLPLTLPLTTLEWGLTLIGNLSLAWLLISLATLRLPSRALSLLIGWPMRRLSLLTQQLTAALERGYAGLIERALSRPLALISLTGLLVWGSWQLQANIPRSLLPEVEQGALIVELEYPVGTPLEQTRGRVQRWLTRLLASRAPQALLHPTKHEAQAQPLIKRAELLIGQDEGDEQSGDERGVHQARLALTLASRGLEEHTSARLRAWADEEPGLKLKVKRPSLLTLKPPLRVALRGHRLSDLKEAERLVYLALKAQPGLSDVERSMEQGYPEVRVEYEGARLSYLGLSPLEVAEQLRAHITGVEALELRWDSVMTPIVVRSQGAHELNSERLGELLISAPARLSPNPLTAPITDAREAAQARPLSLASVATLSRGEGPAEIRHLDGQRAAEVSAYASAFELGERAAALEEALKALALPAGVEVSLAGQESEMKESSRALTLTLLLSLFLVFVVMATQFESVRAPLLIMGSVPLAGVGVLIGLWWTQTPLSVVVFVGLITLSGVVVNNAIVYLDAAQRYVGQGLSATSALIEAGRARLRPILMTTLTTLIGLLPMLSSSGEGAELRAPLALTLIFGLSASTLLVLFVLPALSISLAPPTAREEREPSPTSPTPTQEVSA